MPVRPVLRYPHPMLKSPAAPAGTELDPLLAADLVDTMYAGPATIGLAAPQIGRPIRTFALDVSNHPKATTSHGLLVLFDPEVLETEGAAVVREGCLSVPDLTANIRRPERVALRARTPDGSSLEISLEGFEARAALHELDHLDGMLILDRVASAADLFPRRVYR